MTLRQSHSQQHRVIGKVFFCPNLLSSPFLGTPHLHPFPLNQELPFKGERPGLEYKLTLTFQLIQCLFGPLQTGPSSTGAKRKL